MRSAFRSKTSGAARGAAITLVSCLAASSFVGCVGDTATETSTRAAAPEYTAQQTSAESPVDNSDPVAGFMIGTFKDAQDVIGALSLVKSVYDLYQLAIPQDPNKEVLDALSNDMRALQGQLDSIGLQNAHNRIQSALDPSAGLEQDFRDWRNLHPTQPFALDGTPEAGVNSAVGNLSQLTNWMRPRSAQQDWQRIIPDRAGPWLLNNVPTNRQHPELWDEGNQWDWRVGLFAYVQAITERMLLLTAGYPDWQRYPRGYIEEFAGYADTLDDVGIMMWNGIKCGVTFFDIPFPIGFVTRYLSLECVDVSSDRAFGTVVTDHATPDTAYQMASGSTPWVEAEVSKLKTQVFNTMPFAQLHQLANSLRFRPPVEPVTSGGFVSESPVYATTAYTTTDIGTTCGWVNEHDVRGWMAQGQLLNSAALPAGAPIAMITRQTGCHDLFAVDKNGALVTRYACDDTDDPKTDPYHWQSISFGGTFPPGAPVSAVSRSVDDIDVFAVSNGGQILDVRWDGRNPQWAAYGGWADPRYPIVVGTAPVGAHLAASARTMLKLDLAWIDANGRITAAYWDGFPQAPGGWSFAASTTSGGFRPGSPIAVATHDGVNIDLFGVTTTGALANFGWHGAAGWDRDYQVISDGFFAQSGGPIAAVAENGEVDVFAAHLGTDGHLVSNRSRGRWDKSAAAIVPVAAGAHATQIGAASIGPGSAEVFVADAAGDLWQLVRIDTSSPRWTVNALPACRIPIALGGIKLVGF
jgi:hypothetical protein